MAKPAEALVKTHSKSILNFNRLVIFYTLNRRCKVLYFLLHFKKIQKVAGGLQRLTSRKAARPLSTIKSVSVSGQVKKFIFGFLDEKYLFLTTVFVLSDVGIVDESSRFSHS